MRVHVRGRGAGAVLLGDPIAGVAVRRLLVAQAAAHHPPLFKVGGAALAGVAAHAVLPAAGLQDRLPGERFPVPHIHKQPAVNHRKVSNHISALRLTYRIHVGCFLPVNVCRCCDFVELVMRVSVAAVAVFLFSLRMLLLLLPFAELQGGVFARVYPHLKQTAEVR